MTRLMARHSWHRWTARLILTGAFLLLFSSTSLAAVDRSPYRSLTPWVTDLIRIDHGLAPQLDWSAPDAPDPTELREAAYRRPAYPTEGLVEAEHMLLHYDLTDDKQVAMAAFIEENDLLDVVWDTIVGPRATGGLAWHAPAPDNGNGGDDRYDVYIDNLMYGLYGVTYADAPAGAYQYTAYTVIGDWMDEGETEVTLAHEFSHACQYAWDALEDVWWFESPAIWIEDIVFDDVNDYTLWIYDSWRHPELPLDDPRMAYPHGIFVRWMSETFGNDIVRKIWARAAETSVATSIRSCRDVVNEEEGPLDWSGTLHGYHKALVDRSRFDEGDLYEKYKLGLAGTVSQYPGTIEGNVDYTAGNIVELEVLGNTDAVVTATLDGAGLVATLMMGNETEWVDIPFETQEGSTVMTVSTGGLGQTFDRAYVVISNPAIQGSVPYTLDVAVDGWEGCEQQRVPLTSSWAMSLLVTLGLFGLGRSFRRRA